MIFLVFACLLYFRSQINRGRFAERASAFRVRRVADGESIACDRAKNLNSNIKPTWT